MLTCEAFNTMAGMPCPPAVDGLRAGFRRCWTPIVVLAVIGVLGAPGRATADGAAPSPLGRDLRRTYEGSQGTLYYALTYAYVFHAGSQGQPASIDFTGKLVPRRGLGTLIIRLHFRDADGNNLATHTLYAPGAWKGAGRATIQRQMQIPAGTEYFDFSHVAREQRTRMRR
jgi:hypothetical protein